jgi:hypothetical protein
MCSVSSAGAIGQRHGKEVGGAGNVRCAGIGACFHCAEPQCVGTLRLAHPTGDASVYFTVMLIFSDCTAGLNDCCFQSA